MQCNKNGEFKSTGGFVNYLINGWKNIWWLMFRVANFLVAFTLFIMAVYMGFTVDLNIFSTLFFLVICGLLYSWLDISWTILGEYYDRE